MLAFLDGKSLARTSAINRLFASCADARALWAAALVAAFPSAVGATEAAAIGTSLREVYARHARARLRGVTVAGPRSAAAVLHNDFLWFLELHLDGEAVLGASIRAGACLRQRHHNLLHLGGMRATSQRLAWNCPKGGSLCLTQRCRRLVVSGSECRAARRPLRAFTDAPRWAQVPLASRGHVLYYTRWCAWLERGCRRAVDKIRVGCCHPQSTVPAARRECRRTTGRACPSFCATLVASLPRIFEAVVGFCLWSSVEALR